MKYNTHDELTLKSGKIVYVSEDKIDSIVCFDTDDWNDVADACMYNMHISYITVKHEDVLSCNPFTIVYSK